MGSYTTRAISKNEYKKILDTLRAGYFFKGVQHKPNEKIATILIIERNLGVLLSDVIKLKKEDIVKEGDHYRLDIIEQKTGKKRFYTVPTPVRDFIYTYLTVPPKTELWQDDVLFKRFEIYRSIYNAMLGHRLKEYRKMLNDENYKKSI